MALDYSRPAIWLRLQLPSTFTLAQVDTAIRLSFELDDRDPDAGIFHTRYGDICLEDFSPRMVAKPTDVVLRQVVGVGETIEYSYETVYAHWNLLLEVERQLDFDESSPIPRCVAGRLASPPYCPALREYEAMLDPADADDEYLREEYNLDEIQFDPTDFDPADVTARLARARW